mmetsp:Transcript_15394/g.18670  ORF Transcript_15394/g.18670 Transcript_15394/m.18670 type:complete len:358 (+) Transcript_15394:168-1241(+)
MSLSPEECIRLAPASICGSGDCNQSTCICSGSFTQSSELSLYLTELPSDDQNSGLVCDTVDNLITVLYVLALLSCIYAAYQHQIRVKTRKHCRRLLPVQSAYFCGFLLSLVRLIDSKRYLAQDAFFTALFALCWFFAHTSSLVFYNKFIVYQSKSSVVARLGLKSRIRIDLLISMQAIVQAVDAVFLVLVVASGFTDSVTVDRTLIKMAFGLYTLRNLYSMWSPIYYIGILIADFESLFQVIKEGDSTSGLKTHLQQDQIPALKLLRKITFIYPGIHVGFYSLPLFWNYWLNLWKYFIPIQIVLACLMNVEVLKAMEKGRGKGSTSEGDLVPDSQRSSIVASVQAYRSSHVASNMKV